MQVSRRTVLGSFALTGLGTAVAWAGFGSAQKPPKKRPKNIIFCVADGMAMSAVTMADVYRDVVLGQRGYWSELMEREDVVTGLQDTRSLSSLVTDSSAAASAWGSGSHIWNGQCNMFPDGTKLRPIADIVHAAGLRVGLVTTTTITHATPSGFSVQSANRGWEDLIAEAHLTSGVDVLMGGGANYFDQEKRRKNRRHKDARDTDLFGEFAAKGFQVVQHKSALKSLKPGKVLGIFSDSHLPYTVDHVNTPELLEKVPTLAEMTEAALNNLKNSPKGFLLQVEGGRVDHGGHSNDVAALVFDQIAFEEAVKKCIEFAERDGNTLVVITSDHACGGPALNGSGSEEFPMAYFDSTKGFKLLSGMKSSYGPIQSDIGKNPTVKNVKDVVKARLNIELESAEALAVVGAMVNESPFKLGQFHGSAGATLAMVLGNHTKVTWTSGNHTSDHVLLSAFGPGSELFRGITRNIDVFSYLLGLLGLSHKNPTMDFETAWKYVQERYNPKNTVSLIDPCMACEEEAMHVH